MASIENTARRTAFALAVAVAVATIAAPAAAIIVSSPDVASPRVVADPGDCSDVAMAGDDSLDCAPGDVPVVGAPSETGLTDTNVGIESPVHTRR